MNRKNKFSKKKNYHLKFFSSNFLKNFFFVPIAMQEIFQFSCVTAKIYFDLIFFSNLCCISAFWDAILYILLNYIYLEIKIAWELDLITVVIILHLTEITIFFVSINLQVTITVGGWKITQKNHMFLTSTFSIRSWQKFFVASCDSSSRIFFFQKMAVGHLFGGDAWLQKIIYYYIVVEFL